MRKPSTRAAELPDSPGSILTVDPRFDCGARTDKGQVRENNEDSFRVAAAINLFVLSDGMGGQASGEIASQIATDAVVEYCRKADQFPSSTSAERISGLSETSSRLAAAIQRANASIRKAAQNNQQYRGMGATVVAVQVEGGRMSVAHVGDSRAYRLRSSQLEQLTNDHSFVAEQVRRGIITEQEAEQSQLQNVLLRALGQEARVEVEVSEELLLDGDAILLCSDGLTRELSDAQIAAILAESDDAQAAADRLVDFANEAGGEDNITAIVLRSGGKHHNPLARFGRWLKGPKES
jgi:PPM family protein phosphatase